MSGKNDRNIGGIFQKEMLVFTPQALGSQPIPGRIILCNPNPFLLSKALSILHASRLWSEKRYYVNQNKKPSHSMLSCIHASLEELNLNIIVEVCLLNRSIPLTSFPNNCATLRMETEEIAL